MSLTAVMYLDIEFICFLTSPKCFGADDRLIFGVHQINLGGGDRHTERAQSATFAGRTQALEQ